MGTFEASPFGNDTALDLVDELLDLDSDERVQRVADVFEEALNAPVGSVVPEEVIAAAAVLVVNSSAEAPSWAVSLDEQVAIPAKQISAELCQSAIQAMSHSLPSDGWWWRSWTDLEERQRMHEMLSGIEIILRSRAK